MTMSEEEQISITMLEELSIGITMTEEEQINRTLPEHLVERIMARLPYPEIFKVRLLSKSWLAKLSPVSSQEVDEEKKLLAVSFQNLIRQHSGKWKTFSPAFVGEKALVSYDRAFHRDVIAPLSFQVENCLQWSGTSFGEVLDIDGVLMLIAGRQTGETDSYEELYVVNVLTQSWKHLPAAPEAIQRNPGIKLVNDTDSYKVIEVFSDLGYSFAKIYNSLSGLWRSKRIDLAANLVVVNGRGKSQGKSLNGVLYWIICLNETAWGLLAFSIKEETFTVIEMPRLELPTMPTHLEGHLQLMVCNGSLLLLVYVEANDTSRDRNIVIVMKIDVGSRRWLEMSRSSELSALHIEDFCHLGGSDGDSIFFFDLLFEFTVAYDMQQKEWKFFDYPKNVPFDPPHYPAYNDEYQENVFSFQPGLNPFVTP